MPTWTITKLGLECWQSGLMQLSRKQSHCEVPEVRILHIPRWGSSTTPEGKCLPLVLACLEMKAADASVTATWRGWSCFMGVTILAYGIGATGSMAVSKTVDVGSSPTCCAQPTHRLWERSSGSSYGGSCFWMLGRVAYCTTLLRWRPGTVRGFDSLSIRSPWLAVKSHFCHWVSFWRFGLDDRWPPCFW